MKYDLVLLPKTEQISLPVKQEDAIFLLLVYSYRHSSFFKQILNNYPLRKLRDFSAFTDAVSCKGNQLSNRIVDGGVSQFLNIFQSGRS